MDQRKKKLIRKQKPQKRKISSFVRGASLPSVSNMDPVEEALTISSEQESEQPQAWLKFEGRAIHRISSDGIQGIDRQDGNRTHFPKRPGGIQTGDIIFLAAVTYDRQGRPFPVVVGKATAQAFSPKKLF